MFLALPNAEASSQRVFNRVISGGHNIPAEDIVRRFPLGLRNFFELYLSLADKAMLFDSTDSPPIKVAEWAAGTFSLFQPDTYEKLKSKL